MLLAFWDGGGWQAAATIGVIILVAYLLVMWIGSIVWTYRDIQARSRDPFAEVVSVLLVVIFNFPGILIYMVLRPKDTLAELYDRRLGSEALLHELRADATCPACRRKIDDQFVSCPYCRTALRAPCDNCGKALMTSWVLCPFCSTDRVPAVPRIAAVPSPITPPAAPEQAAPQPTAPVRAVPMSSSRTPPAVQPPPISENGASDESARAPRRRRASTATYTPPAPAPAVPPPAEAQAEAGS